MHGFAGRVAGVIVEARLVFEVVVALFEQHVDGDELLDMLSVARTEVVTPLMFEYQLSEMARQDKRRIVLPESGDDRILEAASAVLRRGTAEIILLGDQT